MTTDRELLMLIHLRLVEGGADEKNDNIRRLRAIIRALSEKQTSPPDASLSLTGLQEELGRARCICQGFFRPAHCPVHRGKA